MDKSSSTDPANRPAAAMRKSPLFSPLERAQRYDCKIKTVVRGRGFQIDCLLVNVSSGGAALRGKELQKLSVDDRIELNVQTLPKLIARVRWVGQSAFGVAFDAVSRDNRQLKAFVDSLAARHASDPTRWTGDTH